MLGEIERLNERAAENCQTRIWIDAERAGIDNKDTGIETLFRYWRERSFLEDGVPALTNFNPPMARTPWVDVGPDNPLRFVMRDHPAGVCGNWEAATFAEHAIPIHAKACAREYHNCKSLRAPTYIYTQQKMLGIEREYTKLLLPLADETGAVTRVVYAWRFIKDPIVLSWRY
jgi:hypothetical protein